jgi:hypothetical protein
MVFYLSKIIQYEGFLLSPLKLKGYPHENLKVVPAMIKKGFYNTNQKLNSQQYILVLYVVTTTKKETILLFVSFAFCKVLGSYFILFHIHLTLKVTLKDWNKP